jgi:hypothetical protein
MHCNATIVTNKCKYVAVIYLYKMFAPLYLYRDYQHTGLEDERKDCWHWGLPTPWLNCCSWREATQQLILVFNYLPPHHFTSRILTSPILYTVFLYSPSQFCFVPQNKNPIPVLIFFFCFLFSSSFVSDISIPFLIFYFCFLFFVILSVTFEVIIH